MIPVLLLEGGGRDTNNFCLFKKINPGHSWDQDPTFAISIHNSSICYHFLFAKKHNKKPLNHFARAAAPQQQ